MKSNKYGFTLIEVLISMFLFSITMLGMLSGFISQKKIIAMNSYRDIAVELANDEITRIRSENFDSAVSICSSSCDPQSTDPDCFILRSYRNENVKFGKSIQIATGSNPDLKDVTVTICWKVYGKDSSYSMGSIIRKY